MYQRDKMRQIYRLHHGDMEQCVTDYAAAERRGEVARNSNEHGLNAAEYARALFNDGVRKGWIEE